MASRYERLLRNPKGDLLVGVPTLTPIPTQKQRLTAKFVVKCNSTSTNELKVKWCPHAILCNDVDTVRIEGGVVDRHVGGVGIRGNSKYTNSQFLNDSVKARLVAARLDVQAVGGQSNGTFYGGYGRDGRVVGTYSADDVTKLLNEKSSVAVPASGNEVHLMYRPSDEDEREEWVTDCRDGPLPNQTITSTDYPARGIVIWKGNGDAATTIEAGSGGTYYEAGTARSDLYFAGSSYSLYAGDGATISGFGQGNQVTYVTSEYGNTARSMVDTPSDMDNDFNNGTGPVPVSSNAGLGRVLSNLRYDCILESWSSVSTLRMLANGGFGGSSTMTYPVVYIQCDFRCKDVHIELEVVTSNGTYEWHTLYDTEHYATTNSWANASGVFSSANGAYVFSAQITGKAFIAPSSGWTGTSQHEIGWNTVFRRMKVTMSNFIDSPYHGYSNYVASLPIRVQYAYRDFYINHYTKKSYQSATGNLIGSTVTGIDRGNAVTGVNLGTQADVSTQGNAITVSGNAVTVPRVQKFLVSITAVVEYCGTAVPTDHLSLARGAVPRPIDSYVGTAFSTPTASPVMSGTRRVIPDTARDEREIPKSKRRRVYRERGMSPPRMIPLVRELPDSARVSSPPRIVRPRYNRDSPGVDDYDFDSE